MLDHHPTLITLLLTVKLIIPLLLFLITGFNGILPAFETGAYIPHYRLEFLPGAENTLGRPVYNPAPHSWDNRIVADSRSTGFPESIFESTWSLKLARTYDAFYLHIPLEDYLLFGESPDLRQLAYLKSIIRPGGQAIYISLIGNSSDYLPVASSEENLNFFVDNLADLCRYYKLDGIDIDWEFPAIPRGTEQESLINLMRNLRDNIPETVKLSSAVSRWRLPDRRLFDIADRIHLMAYDGYGRHSTLESAIADSEIVLTRYNLPSNKLVLGLPFYARKYLPDSEDYWSGTKNYSDIVRDYSPIPSTDEIDGYYFNGLDTISTKIRWALDRELGGIFVWEPFYDTEGDSSLSSAIHDVVAEAVQ